MSRSTTVLAALFVTLCSAFAWPCVAAPDAAASLRWQIDRNEYTAEEPGGRSRAVLRLTSRDALPASGWALYFTCLAGVELGELPGRLQLERTVGTLYRVRPAAGFAGAAAGQPLDIRVTHPEVLLLPPRAPQGPYLVFDAAPLAGRAIRDYEVVVPTGREPATGSAAGTAVTFTAADVYARNASIAPLPAAAVPVAFPTPRSLIAHPGELRWSRLPVIRADAALLDEQAWARKLLQPYFTAATSASASEPALRLAVAPLAGATSPEAYRLVVDPRAGVSITGQTPAGVARGIATLRELLPLPGANPVALPALEVNDAPRFAYRGLLMDVARNFQTPATVEHVLDLMARYKLNTLHLHLTEDEGWRLAIQGLPELTDVGSRRGHTDDSAAFLPPAYGSGPDVDDPHGSGHYTRAEFISILKYAARLHIDVIPELEMPGHARAAVKAMEARTRRLELANDPQAREFLLSDPADRSVYRSAQAYSDNVMNPALPSTYAFIEYVVRDVAAMYREAGVRLDTIHVGGDEVPAGVWTKSPACDDLKRSAGLATTADLWNHFQGRVDAILRSQGLRASGWEELGAHRPASGGTGRLEPNPAFRARDFTLYVWNNLDDADDLAYRLANAGYDVVLAPATRLYLDMAPYPLAGEIGVNWAAYTDLDSVFDYVPLDDLRRAPADAQPLPGRAALTPAGRAHVRGIEGTLFAETVRDPSRIDDMLMPRLLALAERAWAPDPAWAQQKDSAQAARLHAAAWSAFVHQVGTRLLPRLDAEGADVTYRIPTPGLARVDGQWLANLQLPGFDLRYTTDGAEPTAQSPLVAGPLTASGRIRVAAFNPRGRAGRSSAAETP